jgi:hypothetical protein
MSVAMIPVPDALVLVFPTLVGIYVHVASLP